MEEVQARHRKEKKDLQARIQNIKKGVPKGDRQKRAAAIAKIQQLEKALAARQEAELAQCQSVASPDTVTATGDLLAACSLSFADTVPTTAATATAEANSEAPVSIAATTRQSRAARRREKAAAEQRALAEAVAQSQSTYQASSSGVEFAQLAEVLAKRNLVLHKVPSDGDCLFASLAHQLDQRGHSSVLWEACRRFDVSCDTDCPPKHNLRRLAIAVMRRRPEEFLPFMCDTAAATPDSEGKSSDDVFEAYLKDMAKPGTWGGHLELSALSSALQLPIEVIQVKGPPLTVGNFPDQSPLIITYHHHAFSLGEHYNSCKPIEKN
ncbi:OTU domain-containing protein 6B [Sparganum proliferum]